MNRDNYILSTNLDSYHYTKLKRNALVDILEDYPDHTIYHLVLTYKYPEDKTLSEFMMNKFFTQFYIRYFLPYLFRTKNYNRKKYRYFQPICLAFIHEHEHAGVVKKKLNKISLELDNVNTYAERLHHHAVIAVHPEHRDRMDTLLGENTLKKNFSHTIKTSFVAERPSSVVWYASNSLHQYPNFLSFPDRDVYTKSSITNDDFKLRVD